MIFDCGLCTERPTLSPTFNWVRTAPIVSMPQKVVEEWGTLFSTPGFTLGYFISAFDLNHDRARTLFRYANDHSDAALVAQNWLSITREDNIRLAAHRAPMGILPLCVRMQIADDLKHGAKQNATAKLYRVHHRTVDEISRWGPFNRAGLPSMAQLSAP